MWYVIEGIFCVSIGIFVMGIFSGRAYEKGYEDATHAMMIKEIVK